MFNNHRMTISALICCFHTGLNHIKCEQMLDYKYRINIEKQQIHEDKK